MVTKVIAMTHGHQGGAPWPGSRPGPGQDQGQDQGHDQGHDHGKGQGSASAWFSDRAAVGSPRVRPLGDHDALIRTRVRNRSLFWRNESRSAIRSKTSVRSVRVSVSVGVRFRVQSAVIITKHVLRSFYP